MAGEIGACNKNKKKPYAAPLPARGTIFITECLPGFTTISWDRRWTYTGKRDETKATNNEARALPVRRVRAI